MEHQQEFNPDSYVAATAWGLDIALDLGAAAIALLSVSAISLAISIDRVRLDSRSLRLAEDRWLNGQDAEVS